VRHHSAVSSTTTQGAVPTGNTYDKYASTNPVERRLMAGFLRRLDSLLPDPAGPGAPRRILEVGTGEGRVATHLAARYPGAAIVGIDLPDAGLAAHWLADGLTAAFASAERLPFLDAEFDLVLAVEMLEHVPRPEVVLAEIARVARRDVVATVPWEPWWRAANLARGKYVRALGNTPGHIQHWSRRGFTQMVGRHVRVTASTGSFPWTLVAGTVR
jgi:ubiquinone/menaquinone biosynthesis C-methylase UbiE